MKLKELTFFETSRLNLPWSSYEGYRSRIGADWGEWPHEYLQPIQKYIGPWFTCKKVQKISTKCAKNIALLIWGKVIVLRKIAMLMCMKMQKLRLLPLPPTLVTRSKIWSGTSLSESTSLNWSSMAFCTSFIKTCKSRFREITKKVPCLQTLKL